MTNFQLHILIANIYIATSFVIPENKGTPIVLGLIWTAIGILDLIIK